MCLLLRPADWQRAPMLGKTEPLARVALYYGANFVDEMSTKVKFVTIRVTILVQKRRFGYIECNTCAYIIERISAKLTMTAPSCIKLAK